MLLLWLRTKMAGALEEPIPRAGWKSMLALAGSMNQDLIHAEIDCDKLSDQELNKEIDKQLRRGRVYFLGEAAHHGDQSRYPFWQGIKAWLCRLENVCCLLLWIPLTVSATTSQYWFNTTSDIIVDESMYSVYWLSEVAVSLSGSMGVVSALLLGRRVRSRVVLICCWLVFGVAIGIPLGRIGVFREDSWDVTAAARRISALDVSGEMRGGGILNEDGT